METVGKFNNVRKKNKKQTRHKRIYLYGVKQTNK